MATTGTRNVPIGGGETERGREREQTGGYRDIDLTRGGGNFLNCDGFFIGTRRFWKRLRG